MMIHGLNGGRLGKNNETKALGAMPGSWSSPAQALAKSTDQWPLNIITTDLQLYLDASRKLSYPGTGDAWMDLSGHQNAASLYGPSYDSTGGGNFLFDGTDDYGRCPLVTNAITNVTIQCWVYLSSASKKGLFVTIGGGTNGYGIGVGDGDADTAGNEIIGLFAAVRWIDTNTTYGTGWKFVTMILDSSSVPSFYLDSTSVGAFSGTNPITPTGSTWIGSESFAARAFGGNIAQAMIYSAALTAAEVSHNYNATKARFGL